MATSDHHDTGESLREEILATARRDRDQILRQARQDADALLAQAGSDAVRERQERLDAARAAAARARELILAAVPVEAGRMRAARLEAVLDSIHQEIRGRMSERAGVEVRDTLIALAAAAIGRMPGDRLVVALAPADRAAFGDGLIEAMVRQAGRPSVTLQLADDAAIAAGGVIIRDAEGRQLWDNRLPARLERLWPELRRQLARHLTDVAGTGFGGMPIKDQP